MWQGDVLASDKSTVIPRFAKELPPELAVLVRENQEFKLFQDQMSEKTKNAAGPTEYPLPGVVQMKSEVQGGA